MKRVHTFFLLNWKKIGILFLAEAIFIVLHNLVSALFGTEEALFFILAVLVLPLYFLLALCTTILSFLFHQSPKNV